jgi:hypothetical protein
MRKPTAPGPLIDGDKDGEIPQGIEEKMGNFGRSPASLQCPGLIKKRLQEKCVKTWMGPWGSFPLDEQAYQMTVLPFGWWQ